MLKPCPDTFLFRKEGQVEVYIYMSTYEKAWKQPLTNPNMAK
jgi:hypothetical protein